MNGMDRRQFGVLFGVGVGSLAGGWLVADRMGGSTDKTVSIASVDTVPERDGFLARAEMLEDTITRAHTATLRVTLENHTDHTLTIGDGPRRVFSTLGSEERDPSLLLLSVDENPLKRPGCWRVLRSPALSMVLGTVDIPAGDRASIDLAVWGASDNDLEVCVPRGEFRFETTYSVAGQRVPWGFTLTVD